MVLTRAQIERQNEGGEENTSEGVRRIKKQKGVNKRKEAAMNDPSVPPPYIFPGCSSPAPPEYSSAIPKTLPDDDHSSLAPNSSYEDVASRLVRLMAKIPHVSLFPYPMITVRKPKRRLGKDRGKHIKTGDDRFSFTSTAMMRWEKGEKKIRMGIFLDYQKGHETGHTWAIAIVDLDQGKRIVVYDPASSTTHRVRGKLIYEDDIGSPQRLLWKMIKSTKKVKDGRINVKKVFWGGGPSNVVPGENKCLEATMRWMESCTHEDYFEEENLLNNGFVELKFNPTPDRRRKARAMVEQRSHGSSANIEQDQSHGHGQEFLNDADAYSDKEDWEATSDDTKEDPNDTDYREEEVSDRD